MDKYPHILVGWMIVGMGLFGVGLTLGWSFWLLGILGTGLLSVAYMMTQKTRRQACDSELKIRTSLDELRQVLDSQRSRSSFSSSPEVMCSEIQDIVEQAKDQIGNLKREQEKCSIIVQNLVEGVLAFDAHGQFLFSNTSACRILGLDEQQLKGRSVWEVIRNKELAEVVEECRGLNRHERQRAEIDIHVPKRMAVEVYGLALPLAHQKNGSVIVLHDVTQLRRLEQVRAEFIDNVSHEIRTPLAAIIGYLETLLDEPSLETPNNRKFVHVAHQHAERLSRLVNDLRSLSEIESGKVVLRLETVALKNLIDEVAEMFHGHIQKKHLHFDNQIDVESMVWADRDRLVQILLNLVDNAIKYSDDGGRILFQVKRLDDTLVLQVTDTGQGIPSTDLPRVTERFYRVDRARSREEGGTGLGLSIVKHLVQLLGGQLGIHSEIGKGTRIEIELSVPSQENSPAPSS